MAKKIIKRKRNTDREKQVYLLTCKKKKKRGRKNQNQNKCRVLSYNSSYGRLYNKNPLLTPTLVYNN